MICPAISFIGSPAVKAWACSRLPAIRINSGEAELGHDNTGGHLNLTALTRIGRIDRLGRRDPESDGQLPRDGASQ